MLERVFESERLLTLPLLTFTAALEALTCFGGRFGLSVRSDFLELGGGPTLGCFRVERAP